MDGRTDRQTLLVVKSLSQLKMDIRSTQTVRVCHIFGFLKNPKTLEHLDFELITITNKSSIVTCDF